MAPRNAAKSLHIATSVLDTDWSCHTPPRPSPTDTIASGYSSTLSWGSNTPPSTSTSFPSSSASSNPISQLFSLPAPTTEMARAMYDFSDPDPAILSFDKGDIIEIMSKHPSGWWDCITGTTWNGYGLGGNVRRGWVPSNYVKSLENRSQAQAALYARAGTASSRASRLSTTSTRYR
ncbi:SH3 domain-containing protein [Ephemerocybe angulata]|uniref:SH3 domain-containing protein n=1 Tax=Ephemerocybe angulata TaxID=980116 RepID=A0A8H6HFS4_9AGAR|nr:SH3 domain-containing protein [Tulosesus angulatus]